MATVGHDNRLNYYRQSGDEVLAELRGHRQGLTNPEAERRHLQHGANTLLPTDGQPIWHSWLQAGRNRAVWLLLAAGVLTLIGQDWLAAGCLLVTSGLVVTAGWWREHRPDRLLHAVPEYAVVMRSGVAKRIPASQLVLGDIVQLAPGDRVPADLRLLEAQQLHIDELILTGHSRPVHKFSHTMTADVPLAARHNLAFLGSAVASGHGVGIVTGIGMHSELGRVASLAALAKRRASPLQHSLHSISHTLSWLALGLLLTLTIVTGWTGQSLNTSLLLAASLLAAAAAIGLPLASSLALSRVARQWGRHGLLVVRPAAIDTLGAVNVLLLDDTALLANQPVATRLLLDKTTYDIRGGKLLTSKTKGLGNTELAELDLVFAAAGLTASPHDDVLVSLSQAGGQTPLQLAQQYPRVTEFPWSVDRQLHSSLHRFDNRQILLVRGDAAAVLARTERIWDRGHTRKLSATSRRQLTDRITELHESGQSAMALAYRQLPEDVDPAQLSPADVEQQLCLLAIVALDEPLVAGAAAALASARATHVATSLLSDQPPVTAQRLARRAGLTAPSQALTITAGHELAQLPDDELLGLLTRGGNVFCQVSPDDKLRLVELAKQRGQLVAATGFRGHDTAVLRAADVGIGLQNRASQSVLNTADLVLSAGGPGVLVAGIAQGRLAFANLSRLSRASLTDSVALLGLVVGSVILRVGWHVPAAITTVQLLVVLVPWQLWPQAALSGDPAQRGLTHDKPRQPQAPIMDKLAVSILTTAGLLAALLASGNFVYFFFRHDVSPVNIATDSRLYAQATALTCVTLLVCLLINLLVLRLPTHGPFFTRQLFKNRALLAGLSLTTILLLTTVYGPLQALAGMVGLDKSDWLWAFIAASVYFCSRLLMHHEYKHSRHHYLARHRQLRQRASSAKA